MEAQGMGRRNGGRQAGASRQMLEPPALGGTVSQTWWGWRCGATWHPRPTGASSADLPAWTCCSSTVIPDWSLPLTGLQSLTRLAIACDTLDMQRGGAFPPALCHLPALRCLELVPPTW